MTVSLTQGNTTVIASGLDPGDMVVTDGQDKLQTGSRIEPRNSDSEATRPAEQNGVSSQHSGTPGS